MKFLLPGYGSKMLAFARQTARLYHHAVAVILNPDSGPGADPAKSPERAAYAELDSLGAESWLYIDAITGPQYSAYITAGGALETPKVPRTKTVAEVSRELARYTAAKFTNATGFFVDDTTTAAHQALIAEALAGRATMPNPGNWKDAQKFRGKRETTGLVIYEADNFLGNVPKLKGGEKLEKGLAVLALRCPAKQWREAHEAALNLGATYFYATDQSDPWNKPASYAEEMARVVTSL